MTQATPPSSPTSPSSSSNPSTGSAQFKPKGKTKFARRIDRFLFRVTDSIDVVGSRFLGEWWWRQILLAIQDAVAIGCLLWIPSFFFRLFSYGKDFSDLNSCWNIGASDPSFLACLGLVVGEYCFWILFLSRTVARFFEQVRSGK